MSYIHILLETNFQHVYKYRIPLYMTCFVIISNLLENKNTNNATFGKGVFILKRNVFHYSISV